MDIGNKNILKIIIVFKIVDNKELKSIGFWLN